MRPNWHEYYIGLAWMVKERSVDQSTKHGCILTKDNRVIGIGYNGLPRGIESTDEIQSRPLKYSLFLHSEKNALYNCQNPEDSVCYVTGRPCAGCLGALVQNRVSKIYMLDRYGWKHDENPVEKRAWEILSKQIEIETISLPKWIQEVNFDYKELK